MKKIIIPYIGLILLYITCGNQQKDIHTYQIKKTDMVFDITETGELKATNFKSITAPSISWQFGDLKIAHIIDDGKQVKEGDTLIIFEPTEVQKKIQDIEAELEIALAEKDKKIAEQSAKIDELKTNLRLAEISFEIAEIQLEQAKYEAEIKKEEIQLQLNQSKLSLNQAKMEIINQEKIHQEELTQLQLKIDQQRTNLSEARKTLEKLILPAPHSGLVIIGDNWMTRNKWTVGDKPWTGLSLINLPDLSELKAIVQINEVDISKIKLNQEAKVKLDAGSNKYYKGKIISIANLAVSKNRHSNIKVFPVEILIEDADDKLIPDMTVSCQIITNKIPNALFVPNQSIFIENQEKFVMKKSMMNFKKQKITTGLTNKNYTIIENGLKEGDQIALNPSQLFIKKAEEQK